jgi:hypothetical protein
MLSPFRFHADMKTRCDGLLWELGIQFPLERLYQLIHIDAWSDVASERKWHETYPLQPYQLWTCNPLRGGQLHLQDIKFTCPWCSDETNITLSSFHIMHTFKSSKCQCRKCGNMFDADVLSVKYLKQDLSEYMSYRNPWFPPSYRG